MKINLSLTVLAVALFLSAQGQEMTQAITLKSPGNHSKKFDLKVDGTNLTSSDNLPVDIQQKNCGWK
ncbi:hypothetical protein [Sphingobacterium daejeonense]|uniref:hypothetical protein n=1 Tax=Sphingobacterium daejeonense TaxID=371142 RepID=UPI0010C26241|nr:hypothetical protein [Sphingobacterium daejeonense]VTP95531.1 Uncharacterised protein [Sphingobacterium daejeonense]